MAKFTEILIRQGTISPDQLEEAESMARGSGSNLSDALIRLGYVTGDEVMQAVAAEHHLDFINLDEITIPPAVIELVPESVARENAILPMAEEEDALRVIVSDPLDLDAFDKLRFILNRKIEIAVAPRENILQAINNYYGAIEGESADSMLQDFTDTAIDFTETDPLQEGGGEDEEVDEMSAPIVRLAHLIINEAVQLRASDIHIEPFEDRIRIRYRIDGVLVERDSPPRRLLGALLSRLKIMAHMDIAERRRTQDGRIKVTVGEKELDMRVSMLPTNHGQSCVMRLLDKDNIKIGVKQLGLSEKSFQTFYSLIKRPNGIFLVTG
ncbi:MAG: ATPase, T2SS/T4P/T4SS family, partial [Planctomycetota bacterium]|nr:ATPase, T2SS/T4P/T4SS family [Planctomycetota bacterium]